MKPNTLSPTAAAAVESHREALDRALRQALSTSQPALRRQALDEAARHLIHPRLILESPLLTDSHPWRREALTVSDAFEAVTNGMEQPGVLEALDDLDDDSPFLPWKHLILALHFFYEGLDEAVTAHLARIPSGLPAALLGRALGALASETPQNLPGPLARLAEAVSHPDPLVQQWVQDVAEGLEADDEDLFYAALSDWLEAVADGVPDRAKAAVIWAWTQLEWRDFDEAALLDLGSNLWGRAESYRLAALGTHRWDPEGAALLWFRFLVSGCRDGETEETCREARGLLDLFHDAALESGPPAEWEEAWGGLARAWNSEAQGRGWTDLLVGAAAAVRQAPPPAEDGQLDLFSC